MLRFFRMFTVGAFAGLALFAAPLSSQAQEFSPKQKGEIETIVREYLLRNPELLQEIVAELEKKQAAAQAERHKTAVGEHREALFNSPRQITLGNPNGDVTLVEFFDYNCGYCKRALGDLVELLKEDSKLKVVMKEFPVLGPGSVEAAQVSVAVRMQDKTGKKYFAFHRKLLGGRGHADKARALAAAREAGLDMTRLEQDLKSPEIKATIEESMMLAEALGINGTPTYVVAENVVPGAVGIAALKQRIAAARKAAQ